MLTRLPEGPIVERLLILPFPKPLLTGNNIVRMHRMQAAKEKATLREAAKLSALSAKLPRRLPHVWVEFVYRKPTNRRQDSDNLEATTKPLYDGLVDAGLVTDDNPDFMTKLPPVILSPHDARVPKLKRSSTALIISWEQS